MRKRLNHQSAWTLSRLWLAVLLGTCLATSCARSPEQKAARFVKSGKEFLAKKDYSRAAIQFRNAAQVNPKSPEAYYELGLLEMARGDMNSAYRHFEKTAKLDPNFSQVRLKMAEVMATSSEPEVLRKVQSAVGLMLQSAPDNPDALELLATTEIKLGDREQAEKHLRAALVNAPAQMKAAAALALIKLIQHDDTAAEQILRQAADHAPNSLEARLILASFYVATNNTSAAHREIQRVLSTDASNSPALVLLAQMEYREGRREEAGETYRRLSSLPDKRYRGAYALFLFSDGQIAAAVDEFQRLVKENPSDREGWNHLITAYIVAGQYVNAKRIVTGLLKKNAGDTQALLQDSRLQVLVGDYAAAANELSQVLHYHPDSAEAHFLMAFVHQARGASLSRRRELSEALRLNPRFLAARIALAQDFMSVKQPRAALELLDAAHESQRETLPLLAQRNWALLAMGDLRQVQESVAKGLRLGRIPDLLLQDALLKLSRRDFAGARSALAEVLRDHPEDLRALRLLASSYTNENAPAAALAKVREYAAKRPGSARLQYFLGQWLRESGNIPEARAAFAAAASLDHSFLPPQRALAELDVAEGRFSEARQRLLSVLAPAKQGAALSSSQIGLRLDLGYAEAKLGNYSKAIDQWRTVVDADATNVAALNNLAYTLVENAGQPDEALRYAQKAQELRPDDPSILGTLGWVYFHKGLYSSAVRMLESAVSRDSHATSEGAAIRKYHLAAAYAKIGHHEQGERTLAAALKLNPNLPEARAAQQALQSAR